MCAASFSEQSLNEVVSELGCAECVNFPVGMHVHGGSEESAWCPSVNPSQILKEACVTLRNWVTPFFFLPGLLSVSFLMTSSVMQLSTNSHVLSNNDTGRLALKYLILD